MNAHKIEQVKKRLHQKYYELMALSGNPIADIADAEPYPDPYDLASMEVSRDLRCMSRDRERNMIIQLKTALRRIDQGTYGICVNCGNKISEKRLLAYPTVIFCMPCQSEQEKNAEWN